MSFCNFFLKKIVRMFFWTFKMPLPRPSFEPASHGLQTDALTPMAMPADINKTEKQKTDQNCTFLMKLTRILLEIK